MPRKPNETVVSFVIGQAGKPMPPDDLSGRERKIWLATVESCPADWFKHECTQLLRALCFQTVTLEDIEAKIKEVKARSRTNPFKSELRSMIAAHLNLTKSISRLAVDLRLSPKGRYSTLQAIRKLKSIENNQLPVMAPDEEGSTALPSPPRVRANGALPWE